MRKLLLLPAAAACLGCNAFETISGTIVDSRIYPGTTHSYCISVPDG